MSNHPNRSKAGSASRNPTPEEVRQAREAVQTRLGIGITEAQELCASSVHANLRSWQKWETEPDSAENRRMHPAFWELHNIKAESIRKVKK